VGEGGGRQHRRLPRAANTPAPRMKQKLAKRQRKHGDNGDDADEDESDEEVSE